MSDSMSIDEPRATRTRLPETQDQPGRWLGGAIGALTSLGAALVGMQILDEEQRGSGTYDPVGIALLGIPIGWILGRQLFPMARSGWRSALGAAVLVAIAAPPLGAIEILSGAVFQTNASIGLGSSTPGLAALILLPIAIPFSYVALVVTAPVGLVWAVLVRLVPPSVPARLRVPRPLERLGTGHLLGVAAAAGVVAQLVRLAPR
jgi:hypothetical protein